MSTTKPEEEDLQPKEEEENGFLSFVSWVNSLEPMTILKYGGLALLALIVLKSIFSGPPRPEEKLVESIVDLSMSEGAIKTLVNTRASSFLLDWQMNHPTQNPFAFLEAKCNAIADRAIVEAEAKSIEAYAGTTELFGDGRDPVIDSAACLLAIDKITNNVAEQPVIPLTVEYWQEYKQQLTNLNLTGDEKDVKRKQR